MLARRDVKHVGGARGVAVVSIIGYAYNGGAAFDCDRPSEVIEHSASVIRKQLGNLVSRCVEVEHRAGFEAAVVRPRDPDDERVTVDRDGPAEKVVPLAIIGQELLCKIAKIVMKNKDLRIGIQILRMLGEKANNLGLKEITSGLLTPALENFNSKFLNDVQLINNHELLSLYSVLKTIMLSNLEYTTTSESYPRYRDLCLKYSLIPHVKITYTKHVRNLKNNHLLNTQRITIESRRWILKIVPKFDVSEGLSVLKILINKCKV